MQNLIIFSLGLVLGITITIFTLLYLCRIKCPNCQKKKPLKEILVLAQQDKWEIKGQICKQCEQAKKNQQIEIF